MTFGQIRRRITQLHPGLSLDLVDNWIIDRHQEILDSLSWQRMDVITTLVTPAEYSTGTLTATQGSNAVTGDGTVWTADMTGRVIRISAEGDYYAFTRTGDTTGTLDREYTGTGGAALSYRLNQNVYLLDSDVRLVRGVRTADGELTRLSVDELRRSSPNRNNYGEPLAWAWYPDSFTDPPRIQIELAPIPVDIGSLYVDVALDKAGFTAATTSLSLLPWTRPACLIAGVEADILAHLKQFQAAELKEARFGKLLTQMQSIDAEATGPQPLRLAEKYTRHQRRRWCR